MEPRRRKLYLDPDASAKKLPRATAHALRLHENAATGESSSSFLESDTEEFRHYSRYETVEVEEPVQCFECSTDTDREMADSSTDVRPGAPDTGLTEKSITVDFLLEFATPLQSGKSTMSVGDALVLVMDFASRYGLSWSGTEDLLKLINKLLGADTLPQSKHLFRKFCGASPQDMTFSFYCPDCENFLQKTTGHLQKRQEISPECSICGNQYSGSELMKKGSFFVSLPVEKQLSSVLSDSTARHSISQALAQIWSSEGGSEALSDFTDGELYKQQRAMLNCSEYDLTLSMNADGSPVFKSANYSIWPVQLTINEMAPYLRWQFIVSPLLWYGQRHPNMTLLLEEFSSQMHTLATDGISWDIGGQRVNSKIFCISCVADAPARAAMANMMQYNGYYGCIWCLHPGVSIDGCVKYPVTVGAVADRTAAETATDMSSAAACGRTVRGMKGPSPLLSLPGFDIVWGFRPDYMHCALLGVTRQFLELWFGCAGEDYYIGNPQALSLVSKRLMGLKPPQCINRPPRDIRLRKYWKAAECQTWLFYYCLPCVKNVLPERYFRHFALLVSGLYLLMKSHVTKVELAESTEKITEFVVQVQFLYGETHMTSNVHSLLHLPKSTLLHGPLWSLSCFAFESNMGQLLKLVSSSNGVPFQILSRILMRNNNFRLRSMASPDIQKLCFQRLSVRHLGVEPVGKPMPPSQRLTDLVRDFCGEVNFKEYHRVKVCGYVFHSEQYKRACKRDSTSLRLQDSYLKAEHIVLVTCSDKVDKFYIVSHYYKTCHVNGVGHICVAEQLPSYRMAELTEDASPCMYLQIERTVYFAELCNRYEWS